MSSAVQTDSAPNPALLGRLRERLSGLSGVVVAYSGGVDSTFLAKVAHDVLGPKMIAVTAESEIYPTRETREAERIAGELGFEHRIIRTHELQRPEFVENSPLRCYHCKQELFGQLFRVAEEKGFPHVIDGCHDEDREDFRPGTKAARELGIMSPLLELGFRKSDITGLSRDMGLPTWDKPPHPCLSTRFPYGKKITEQELSTVDQAEEFLKALGVGQLRLRLHGDVARIEVNPEDMGLLLDPEVRAKVVEGLKNHGYKYVTLDLEGFRSGSMNETLKGSRAGRLPVLVED